MMNIFSQSESSCNQVAQPVRQNDIFCWCSAKVLCFLFSLLFLTLGLIFGALFALIILISLPAVIVLAIVLAIIIIVILIYKWCKCLRR